MRWLFAAIALLSVSGLAPSVVRVYRPAEVKLRIELSATSKSIRVGTRPEFVARLVNDGAEPITVVLPGDGSYSGRRTPVLRWDPPLERRAGCAHINALRADEVVTLAAGASVPLHVSMREMTLVGKHALSLEMENIPDKQWGGILGGEHDPAALDRLRRTLPYEAKSNVVEIEVRK